MIILGFSCYYHDSAACIIKDGKIIAAASEERFSRIKHDNNFPKQSIEFCLTKVGIAANEVNYFVFYEKPIIKLERILYQHMEYFPRSYRNFIKGIGSQFNDKLKIKEKLKGEFKYYGKVLYVPHHLSHAASTYLLSGFDRSAIVTIDGVGEWATTCIGYGEKGKIRIHKELRFPHSLGLFYSSITSYLGFRVNNDEYKVMGLAAYGTPEPYMSQVNRLIDVFEDGGFKLNAKYFNFMWSSQSVGRMMEKLFGYPRRTPEGKIYKYHKDIAASAQWKLEDVIFKLLEASYKKYRTKNLSMAGGVALNSVVNGKIIQNTPFTNIYIPPDPGDGGGAMGSALYVNNIMGRKRVRHFTPFLGPEYAWYEIEKVVKISGLAYKKYIKRKDLLSDVVDNLKKKNVVAWFQGKMEWGPRALGSRSILACASDEKMRDILNKKVKKREMFRPFAPVVKKSEVRKYFKNYSKGLDMLGKHMLLVLPFTDVGKKLSPAAVHINGTGRPQIIERRDNKLYFDLLSLYMKRTKEPMLINTSFNVRGEPIVCTPQDAIKCFLNTNIDLLVMGDFLITK